MRHEPANLTEIKCGLPFCSLAEMPYLCSPLGEFEVGGWGFKRKPGFDFCIFFFGAYLVLGIFGSWNIVYLRMW